MRKLAVLLWSAQLLVESSCIQFVGRELPGQEQRRVAWFHPPKTATSFGATVFHYANASLPRSEGARHLQNWQQFFHIWPSDQWFNGTIWLPEYDHARVPADAYRRFEGHWVGMFRQPEQRILSSFFEKAEGRGDARVYAERAAGTVVKELAGQEDGERWACWPGWQPTRASDVSRRCGGPRGRQALLAEVPQVPDVQTALARLQEGFMFVGLVEEYDLSVCLFHAMFGGECLPVEFTALRPAQVPGYVHNTSVLQGYKDPFDGALYERAESIFWRMVASYNVNNEVCRRICPRAAGAFGSDSHRAVGGP